MGLLISSHSLFAPQFYWHESLFRNNNQPVQPRGLYSQNAAARSFFHRVSLWCRCSWSYRVIDNQGSFKFYQCSCKIEHFLLLQYQTGQTGVSFYSEVVRGNAMCLTHVSYSLQYAIQEFTACLIHLFTFDVSHLICIAIFIVTIYAVSLSISF